MSIVTTAPHQLIQAFTHVAVLGKGEWRGAERAAALRWPTAIESTTGALRGSYVELVGAREVDLRAELY